MSYKSYIFILCLIFCVFSKATKKTFQMFMFIDGPQSKKGQGQLLYGLEIDLNSSLNYQTLLTQVSLFCDEKLKKTAGKQWKVKDISDYIGLSGKSFKLRPREILPYLKSSNTFVCLIGLVPIPPPPPTAKERAFAYLYSRLSSLSFWSK